MPVERPYRRTCRQFVDGRYSEGGRSRYVLHPRYAREPQHYIRAFLLLQKDLQEMFDYIEPADQNASCYSYRIHELLLRACVEVEANCKAVLVENEYRKTGELTMADYQKIEASHRLSSYRIEIPAWRGEGAHRRPYDGWRTGEPLAWYQAYNKTKHDRHTEFEQATLDHLAGAVSGLAALLSAQFHTQDFAPVDPLVAGGWRRDGFDSAIGGYFHVQFPDDWPEEYRYDFDWQALEREPDPFQVYDYSLTS